MPLNIEDTEGKKGPPQPARSATPTAGGGKDGSPGRGSGRKVILWVLLLIVVASLVFLLVQFGVLPAGEDEAPGTPASRTEERVPALRPPETTAVSPPAISNDSIRMSEIRERLMSEGRYTIYISAFRAEADAEELAGRWTEAGHPAFVRQSDGWYRVGLGRYTATADARAAAERLKQAFEDGYWIGPVETR